MGGIGVPQALERFGVAVLCLLGIGVFFWKALWPFLKDQITGMQAILMKQLHDANEDYKVMSKEFIEALRRRDEQFEKVIRHLENIDDHLEGLK